MNKEAIQQIIKKHYDNYRDLRDKYTNTPNERKYAYKLMAIRDLLNEVREQSLSHLGEAKDSPLTQCMIGRDAECTHPKCPVTDEDEKNGRYCLLPLYDYRE